MNIDTSEQCPMCEGNGKIDSSLILVEKIEAKIHNLVKQNQSDIHISTHPFTASYLNKKDSWLSSSICKKWSKKFKRKIVISGDERLHLLQYSVID